MNSTISKYERLIHCMNSNDGSFDPLESFEVYNTHHLWREKHMASYCIEKQSLAFSLENIAITFDYFRGISGVANEIKNIAINCNKKDTALFIGSGYFPSTALALLYAGFKKVICVEREKEIAEFSKLLFASLGITEGVEVVSCSGEEYSASNEVDFALIAGLVGEKPTIIKHLWHQMAFKNCVFFVRTGQDQNACSSHIFGPELPLSLMQELNIQTISQTEAGGWKSFVFKK